jgi:ATP/maltotriose-dependent transcriptional regulator MalT
VGAQGALMHGREAAQRLEWLDAYTALSLADSSSPLAAQDLELLATAALLLGHVEDGLRALQRAHQLHAEGGDPRRAARCAFWLTFHLGARGDVAQASGWFGRANRLLEHEQECAEHGYLLISVAFHQLVAGDYAAGRAAAAHAAAIGGRTGDADLVAFAWYLQGRALVHEGAMHEGLALVDEAMVAVVTGELSPIVAGAVYCGVIETCQVLSELRRASEWTAALTAWCDTQPDMVTFTGQCLVHRAELLHLHGAWLEAVEEAKRALERFAHGADEFASGDAYYQQAEAYRVLGESVAAEDAYQQASRWGREPQPGLALLRLAQGKTDAAAAAIGRAVAETTDRLRRIKLLPAQVEIMLAAGEVQAALDAADELIQMAGAYSTPALRAMANHARGAVLLASGDAHAALAALRGAWQLWRELQAPYEAARVRVLVGLACRQLGDREAAAMEFDAGRTVFAQLGAAPDLARVEALARSGAAPNAQGLTERELQVLRLLATGTTNHAIANELVLSEKTVHRHVSNIFTKLDVSSRAAATAYAYQHHLL